MKKFTRDDLVVGRVVSEDDGFMLIEIMKREATDTFTLQEGDQFYTLMFVRQVGDRAEPWKPWQE